MRRWLGVRTGVSASKSMTALDEQAALQEAMASAALIMNDEMEQAEAELSRGTSPFHKLGRATALFLRASLGFEKDIMEQASARLAEAEEAAVEHQRRAIRDHSTAHQSEIYPLGAEYALCHAETQIMSAVIAVLNESLTESLRGFYKLRKAFGTLQEITEAERRYLQQRGLENKSDASSSSAASSSAASSVSGGLEKGKENDEEVATISGNQEESEEFEFVDAQEELSDNGEPSASSSGSEIEESGRPPSAAQLAEQDVDFRTITSHPIDLFIHSGNALCYGLLQLLLSFIPPAFAKLLSLFSFRGNRKEGLRLLWGASRFKDNINGAIAGLMVLGIHNGAIAFCDILSKDALPEAKLRTLLREMREQYPQSKLWLLEEARMLSRDRKPEEAIQVVAEGRTASLKQIEALGVFEMSLNLMFCHRYEECAESFIKCVGLNSWSHALYYYIAGACYIELYRNHKSSDPEKAKEYAEKAEKHLHEVPSHVGKKRIMARPLPFDMFVNRKITKWEARAKARNCSFVDAVGVSPLTEMIYFWSGFRRMRPEHFERSFESLAWAEKADSHLRLDSDDIDELAVLNVLRGICQRNTSKLAEAKKTFEEHVLALESHQLKACPHAENWAQPSARYEMAVCYWEEAGGENGDSELLNSCSEELKIVERWESFELDARLGLKIRTARETLRRCGVGPS